MADQVSYGRRLTMLAAEHADDDVAVVFAAEDGGEQPITWKELEARANQVAHFLADREAGKDDVVVVALRNSPEHLFRGFGAWKLGASVLPLRWDLPEWERDRLLAVAREANGKVVVAGWENAAPGTVTPDDIDATRNLSSDPPESDGIPPYTPLIATSGATGSPKIVVTPSPGVMAVDDELTQVMLATPDAPYLTTSPLYHVNGIAYAYNPLLQNNPIVLMERFDAARAVDLIERYHIAYTCMVPTMLMRVARLEDMQSHDFSSIERIVYGGASIPEWVVRAWFELVPPERFAFTYGGSEGLLTYADTLLGLLSSVATAPRLSLTADLRAQIFSVPPPGPIEMDGRLLKTGRTTTLGTTSFSVPGAARPFAICFGTFIGSPRPVDVQPSDRSRTGSADGRTLAVTLTQPMVERLGIRMIDTGVAEVDHRADVLNSSNSIQGGVLAFVAEVAAQSLATERAGRTFVVDDLDVRYLRAARVGPARAEARVLRFSDAGATIEVATHDRGGDNRAVSYVIARCAALDG